MCRIGACDVKCTGAYGLVIQKDGYSTFDSLKGRRRIVIESQRTVLGEFSAARYLEEIAPSVTVDMAGLIR